MPNQHRERSRATLFGLLATLYCSMGISQEAPLQQYEVELVIFKLTNPSHTPEDWSLEEQRAAAMLPSTTVLDDPSAAPEPAAPAVPTTPAAPPITPPVAPATGEGSDSAFQPIDVAQFRMAQIESALRRNRNYQVLAHVAWLQPGFAMNNPRPFALDRILPTDSGVTGTLSLIRRQYLHVSLDLALQSGDKRFILREQRRMRRSGEKHYFDHPVFGVVALITPKEPR